MNQRYLQLFETVGYLVVAEPESDLAWLLTDKFPHIGWQFLQDSRHVVSSYHGTASSCV